MRQGVDRLGPGRLEEQLGDVRAPLVERLDAVGEVAAIRVRFPRERHLKVGVGARAGRGHASHCNAARLRDTVSA